MRIFYSIAIREKFREVRESSVNFGLLNKNPYFLLHICFLR
jgi:hypothetical protein